MYYVVHAAIFHQINWVFFFYLCLPLTLDWWSIFLHWRNPHTCSLHLVALYPTYKKPDVTNALYVKPNPDYAIDSNVFLFVHWNCLRRPIEDPTMTSIAPNLCILVFISHPYLFWTCDIWANVFILCVIDPWIFLLIHMEEMFLTY